MISWKEYYVHSEQHRDRVLEAERRRRASDGGLARSRWQPLLIGLGGRLIAWGEHLQARYQRPENRTYQGIQGTARPMV